MLPPVPSRYTYGTTVPLYESNQIEFKENSISFEKLKKTVCAFLNSIGGYIFIGISDDRRIVGISDRLADRYSLFVDLLISGRSIVRLGGGDLTIKEVSTQIIEVTGGPEPLVLLLISVKPLSTESDYMWATGERYFRLNASNYCRRDEAIELVQLKERVSLLKSDCGKLSSQLTTMMHELRKSMVSEAKATAEKNVLIDLLYERILTDKRKAEKELAAPSLWDLILWPLKCCL